VITGADGEHDRHSTLLIPVALFDHRIVDSARPTSSCRSSRKQPKTFPEAVL
jgi:hypothetical protein